MPLSQFQVFSEFAQTTAQETLARNIALFNEATRGGLILRAANREGDFADATFWQRISGLVRRRDAYGSGAVTPKTLTQLSEASVKVAAGTPPVEIDPHMFQWINKSPEEAGVVLGNQLAEDMLADKVDTGIAAYVAAMGQIAAMTFDGTANNAGLTALNSTAALMGDQANRLAAWLMHSKVAFDIWGANLTNTAQLFTFGTVNVLSDPFGRPFVIADSPSLVDPTGIGAGPDVPSYFTLGLIPGAILVEQNGDYLDNIETSNGDENILRTWQSQWTYNLAVKGFTWDKANGGASPTTAAIATATNWDRKATSDRDLAGVILESK